MKIKINGNENDFEGKMNILKLLEIENVEMPEMVSVEINGDVVDREDFETTIIKENDTIEFLYFMGGGSFGF